MGVVYVAEQTEPVRRRVALKIMKLGMDTKQVVARFEAERQALAVMEHPHIAKVLDGGASETGRPYFVMELVRGVPLTQYCDMHRLSTRDRLALFIPVCHAVQPWEVRLQVGDSLQWNLIEPILSDTIEISLKETERRWPFANPDRPRGRQLARAHGARDRGRFAYNVTLRCPGPDGQPRLVVIDPEFIID